MLPHWRARSNLKGSDSGRLTRFSSGTEVQQMTAPRKGADKSIEAFKGKI